MQGFPKDAKKTGTIVAGMEVVTTEVVPNCKLCYIISCHHQRTNEIGWFAFCKKTGKMDKFGPYKSIYEAIRTLILARGCDSCEFNTSSTKDTYLQEIDQQIEKEIKESLGEEHILTKIDTLYSQFMEYRMYIDISFKDRFGMRLFNSLPDDSVAILDLVKPCKNERDFALKISIIMGLIDRINPEIKNIIKAENKEKYQRSVQIIEQILKENKNDYKPTIISNFRNLINLRGKLYPVHATGFELLRILRNFGIDQYPPEDWESGFTHICEIILNSLKNLNKEIQSITTSS